ncbi:hypothetical protein LHYA1_G000895 [Lachnellula hyalina]|uniref:Uncharacterized protein n=1 Tax=Lachnellula hyalina TaxID=1316788 RepID=A0A8H8U0S6_9HELO|nr:uncharacterized protein LHYA1_G000895 [Lachnellula hyalina]TVY29650.1 hypothetical protein LHYA1_G000895 [Lachnellula hyalina]
MSQDSPLSIAASLTGILTFVFALTAGFYARAISLRSAIDTQAEVSSLLEKIDFLETETDMLNNAYLASQIRHPHRTYGTGDFKYFQGLYSQSLQRMRGMDRELRRAAAHVTGGNSYDKMSRVKTAANWMASRNQMHKNIEERKAESSRIFQIQLAMLYVGLLHRIVSSRVSCEMSPLNFDFRKIDELSYHQNHHNASCSVVLEEIGSLNSAVETNFFNTRKIPPSPLVTPCSPDLTPPPEEAVAVTFPAESKSPFTDRMMLSKDEKDQQDVSSWKEWQQRTKLTSSGLQSDA